MRNQSFSPGRTRSPRHENSTRGGSSYGNRSRHSGYNRGRRGSKAAPAMDFSRFINKAKGPITEAPYVPVNKFADFPIAGRLKNNILEKGYSAPTPIQDQAIPEILRGVDLIGIANTGTGKTAAFLIPFINKVMKDRKEKVLIIAPTRELALQIQEEMNGFAGFMGIFSAICVGGANIRSQMSSLRRRPDFVIGTPGRLKDLVERKCLRLSDYRNLVLDEADRMLDMGFLPDIRSLLSGLPAERQSVFFSATMPKEVEALISEFSQDPIKVSVKSRDTSANVDQDVVKVAPGEDKIEKLHDLLLGKGFDRVLIFGRTKYGVEKLSVALNKRGFKAVSIHGDKTQSNRQRALRMFKEGGAQIMVATDVAARGLDIPNVSHVINFDIPSSYEDYVHRIGRTGRADNKGSALTFVETR